MTRGVLWAGQAITGGDAHRWLASLTVAVACLFLAAFLIGALLIGMMRPDDYVRRLAARIEQYGSRHVPGRPDRRPTRSC